MNLHHRLNRARERGSVVILVVVVIVLIALAGTIYLQIARTDRAITRRMHHDSVDQVATATLAYVKDILKRDLMDEDGNMLRYLDGEDGRVGYDYPWTNDNHPGRGDGMFLSPLTPDFSNPDNPSWRHMTLLLNPQEEPIINPATGSETGADHRDVPIFNNNMLGDATGDGVPDALFQRATLGRVGDIEYIVAARIIDASAMANINVHTRLDGVSGTDGALGIRGYYPTEISLDRLAEFTGEGNWSGELDALLDRRGVSNPEQLGLTSIDPPEANDASTRAGYWMQRARIWHDRNDEWRFVDEVALRHRFGLRDTRQVASIEAAMPGILRRDAANERFYYRAVGADSPSPAAMAAYFQGGTGNIVDRDFSNIRHLLTTRSGHTVIAPNWRIGAESLFPDVLRPMKFDLLNELSDEPQQRMERLHELTSRIFTAGNNNYMGLSDGDARIAAADLAANVHTYSSSDASPRGLDAEGQTFYGLQPLPFIREVYLQWIYEHRQPEEEVPEDPDAEEPGYSEWHRIDNSLGIAIEIGNPFDEPIQLTGGDLPPLRVAVTNDAGAVLASQPIGGNVTLDARDSSREQRTAVLYSDRAGVSAAINEDGHGQNMSNDLNLGAQTINLGPDAIQEPLRQVLSNGRFDGRFIALQVQTEGGSWVSYDRFELRRTTTQQQFFETAEVVETEPTEDPHHRHIQLAYARDGQNWRYLSNRNRQLSFERWDHIEDGADPTQGQFITTVPGFESDEKPSEGADPIEGDERLDEVQLAIARRNILNVAELGWVFMVGFTDDAAAGDIPTRLSGRDGEAGYLEDHETRRLTLDISSDAVLSDMPGAGNMPQAAVLFDVLTTLHPGYDGEDNDGSGTSDQLHDDDGQPFEQWIPGTINVNTAPPEVLALVLPLVEPGDVGDMAELARRIVDYRDNPGNRGGLTGGLGIRSGRPGIASVGELLFINPTGGDDPADMQRFGQSGAEAPELVQFYPLPEDIDENGKQRLPVADSAPEKMARFHRLAQVLSTRSDVFVGYFVIRGYRTGQWDRGPVESARVMAVFDRSEVRGEDDEVKLLGVFRLD